MPEVTHCPHNIPVHMWCQSCCDEQIGKISPLSGGERIIMNEDQLVQAACSHADDPIKSEAYILAEGMTSIKCENGGWFIESHICDGSDYEATGETLIEAIADLVKQTCDDAKHDEAIAWRDDH